MTIVLNLNNFNQTNPFLIFTDLSVLAYYTKHHQKEDIFFNLIKELHDETRKFEEHFIIFDIIELTAYYNEVLTPWLVRNYEKIIKELQRKKINYTALKNIIENNEKLKKINKKIEKLVKDFFDLIKKDKKINPYDIIYFTSIFYLISYYLLRNDFETLENIIKKSFIRLESIKLNRRLPKESFFRLNTLL